MLAFSFWQRPPKRTRAGFPAKQINDARTTALAPPAEAKRYLANATAPGNDHTAYRVSCQPIHDGHALFQRKQPVRVGEIRRCFHHSMHEIPYYGIAVVWSRVRPGCPETLIQLRAPFAASGNQPLTH